MFAVRKRSFDFDFDLDLNIKVAAEIDFLSQISKMNVLAFVSSGSASDISSQVQEFVNVPKSGL